MEAVSDQALINQRFFKVERRHIEQTDLNPTSFNVLRFSNQRKMLHSVQTESAPGLFERQCAQAFPY